MRPLPVIANANNGAEDYEALIDLLAQEEAIYREMLALLDEERDALLHMRVAQVMRLISRKETLALRVKALDESRKSLARHMAAHAGMSPEQVTITVLCEHAPAAASRRLSAAGERLRETVAACKAKNEANGRAAACGMNVVSGAMENLIANADPAGIVYRPARGGARGGYACLSKGSVKNLGLVSRQA